MTIDPQLAFVQLRALGNSFREATQPVIAAWVVACKQAGTIEIFIRRSMATEALLLAAYAHAQSGGTDASFIEMARVAIEGAQASRGVAH